MEDPVHVTLNTSASTMSPCVDTSSGPNRLCACETVPVLRTGFPEDLSKHLLCSKKGGEIDTRHRSTTRNAVGSKNLREGSFQIIQSRLQLQLACHQRLKSEKNLRNWIQSRYREQFLRIIPWPSHFEQEDADNKQHLSELMMMEETHFK